jgi:Domain of unknown function (DUF4349)
MRARRATTVTAVTTASLLAVAGLLAGCGGGGSNGGGGSASSVGDTSGGSAVSAAPQAGGKLAPGASADSGSGSGSGGGSGTENSARVIPITRAVVYHGTITVRVKDVEASVARAEGFATGVDGLVYAEQTSSEPRRKGSSTATMTLKVPPTQFRPVLNELGGLGTQLSRSQTAEDVTSQAVDIASRLRSQQASVARLRALLDRATTVGAIVQVEGELSQRESDLEALEAQQKRLSELVDLATINVTFVTPDVKVAAPVKKDHLGFLTGLGGGWNALVAAVLVALTVAGALLPFVLLVVLLGVPVWLVVRTRRHPAPAPAQATASDG